MVSVRENYIEGLVNEEDIHITYITLLRVADVIKNGGSKQALCALSNTVMHQSMNHRSKHKDRILTMLFGSWDKYSGSPQFPVAANGLDPESAYHRYRFNEYDMWDRTTEYGNNRRDLLLHCINELAALRIEIQNGLKPFNTQMIRCNF